MYKNTSIDREIQLYVKANCSKSKKAIAYARSRSNNVNTIDLSKTKGTGIIWLSILAMLDKSPK
jgi:arsenate reductase-like glutaredoxin family protein